MAIKKITEQLWVAEQGDHYRLGLTNQGQDDFGEITFAMFPKVGTVLVAGDTIVELEAEKAVTELVTPFAGTIVAVNETAALNEPDEAMAWLVELADVSSTDVDTLR